MYQHSPIVIMTPDPNRALAGDEGQEVPPDPLKVLTVNQKDALRLAHDGLNAGEIAVRLNLRTKSAANDRIWEARQKLGGVSKRQAGQMLADAEERAKAGENRRNADDPYSVLLDPEPLWLAPSLIPDQQQAAVNIGGELREGRAAFEIEPAEELEILGLPRSTPERPLRMVLTFALLALGILALMKPVADGFAWLSDHVASPFMWQGSNR
jgi:hypothetical protein